MGEIQADRQQSVVVTGTGATKQQAFASALATVQRQLIAEETETILRIEPLAITPLALTEERYVEKFLFFFFKRQRVTYRVRLQVTVAITAVDLAPLSFTVHELPSPDAIAWPRLKWFSKGAK